MHPAGLEVDLLPAQARELRHALRMPVTQAQKRPIARPVTACLGLARGLEELLDLRQRQVLAGAAIQI
jgi:hypothetical protein